MKSLAAFLFFATFTATNAFSMDSAPTRTASSSGTGQTAGVASEDTFLKRPTPTPAPAGDTAAPKEKKPLTASLGKDNSGKQSLTTFASSDPKIYLVWKAETGTKGEKVRIAWYSDGPKGKKLTENSQVIPGNGSISGSAHIEKPASGFPPGKYRADLYDDGKLAKSLRFVITK